MRKRLINWNNLFYQSGESGNCFRRIFLFGNFAMQNATLYLRYTADLKKRDSFYLPDLTGFSRIFIKNDNINLLIIQHLPFTAKPFAERH